MPLPQEIDEMIRKSLDDLIEKGNVLLQELDSDDSAFERSEINFVASYKELITSSFRLMEIMPSSEGTINDFEVLEDQVFPTINDVSTIIGRLRGEKYNYLNGLAINMEEQIANSISMDYMGQAEALLGEGTHGQYDHIPAAVLCGAVLENRLRSYCEKQVPRIETTKTGGELKTLGSLIGELDRVKAFDKQTRKMLRAWADIRNAAAHGRDDEFTREQVELMLLGVNGFLANHL